MTPTILGILGILVLLLLFAAGKSIGFSLMLVGFIGFAYSVSIEASLHLLAKDFWEIFSSYSLTVIPLFVFMGSIAFYSGISRRLYSTAYAFCGHFAGGLSMATIAACAAFAAICGSTSASAAAMGKVTLPEMKRYNYDPSLSTASVAAGGSLGIMIPPSTAFIIYGILTETSVGKLLIAGIIPGLLLAALFVITVFILCRRNPKLAPPGVRTNWKERIVSLLDMIQMFILFALVMGGLFFGFFTPTEAGAIGAGGALLIALAWRQLTWQGFISSLIDATRISCMIYVILAGAMVFSRFMAVTRIPFELVNWVDGLPFHRSVVMGLIILGYLFCGCLMDSLALVALTIPILLPVVLKLNFDPIWFGVMMVLISEAGVITPPVGVNVYVIKGVAPEVPLETIFKGIWPFVAAILVCAIILAIFPQIIMFLPGLMMR